MFSALIGQSPNFEALIRNARMIAATDVTVLICGETGTGKEILANALRQQSPRMEGPFVALNCAALPETLAESELFGYRKGSFTGAQSSQIGRLQSADGGTLFLDEVNSLPVPLQAKLLRFLESGEIQPIGETATQRVDVRVIAATNVDLHEKIGRGEFRRDLYYRLNVVPLEIPPLRDRDGDVQLLINHFMQQFEDVHNLPPPSFSKGALACMCAYAWPGNVRELRNLCERLSILMAGQVIEENNLPPEISLQVPQLKALFHLPELGVDLEQIEIDLIRQALRRTNGNRARSARLLGISRDTLIYRIQKYRLE